MPCSGFSKEERRKMAIVWHPLNIQHALYEFAGLCLAASWLLIYTQFSCKTLGICFATDSCSFLNAFINSDLGSKLCNKWVCSSFKYISFTRLWLWQDVSGLLLWQDVSGSSSHTYVMPMTGIVFSKWHYPSTALPGKISTKESLPSMRLCMIMCLRGCPLIFRLCSIPSSTSSPLFFSGSAWYWALQATLFFSGSAWYCVPQASSFFLGYAWYWARQAAFFFLGQLGIKFDKQPPFFLGQLHRLL